MMNTIKKRNYSFSTLNKTIVLLMMVLATCCTSCKKDKPVAEPAEYFSCKIDGVYFEAKQNSWTQNKFTTASKDTNRTLHTVKYIIGGTDQLSQLQTNIGLSLNNIGFPQKDNYTFSDEHGEAKAVVYNIDWTADNTFHTSNIHGGTITFTERTKTLVKGTFDFYADYDSTQKVIHITEGKFKIIPNL